MNILALKLIRDLNDLKAQVFTMALLIICGVSVLISSWGSYESLKEAQRFFYEKYHFADVFVDFEKSPTDILLKFKRNSDLEHIEGRVINESLIEVPNQKEPAVGRFVSWHPTQMLNLIYLREGRFPQDSANNEVVVHESFAKAHHLHVGDRLTVFFRGKKTFVEVSGIGISPEYTYALSPISIFPDDKHFGVFWILEDKLMQLSQMQGSYNNIVAKMNKNHSIGTIKLAIDQIIKPYGTLGSYGRDKQLSHIFISDEIKQQKSMAAIIPTIFLMVGSFILNVIMNRLIQLHRGQISILKGMGYSSWELSLYYLKLVTIILLLGIIPSFFLAQAIGDWYALLYERYFRFPSISFAITNNASLIGISLGMIPGWLASFQALSRVYTLEPAEGMRPPPPPAFHLNFIERMGFLANLSILDKIPVRDLIFRPLRSLTTMTGISLATAILVNGTFWMDIIDFMMKRQFHEKNREDIEIRLYKPRSTDIKNKILDMNGVFQIEMQRKIPVRLSYKNFQQETEIIANSSNSLLRRILNRKSETIKTTEQGALVSLFFQKKFNFKIGDIIKLEVLQGTQPVLEMPIAGFVDDIIGASIYLDFNNLKHALKEEDVFDTLLVRIDSQLKENIYIQLMSFPLVASVTVKKLFIESFQKMTAEMILIFTAILDIFAIAIAGAVIFNVNRIILSEKSWELASLRIYGFTIKETFQVLYTQIGLQVLFAIGPGLLIGYGLSYLSTNWIHSEAFLFPLIVESRTYALAVAIILLIFLIGGLYLLQKIIALSLTEALKSRE